MEIKNVNEETFEAEVLNHEGRVLVDFYSDNCGPCKLVGNFLEEIKDDVQTKIVKIDAHENMNLSKDHGVTSIPALFLYQDGEIIKDHVGMKMKGELKDWLDG
jgi:thioredoxin 1